MTNNFIIGTSFLFFSCVSTDKTFNQNTLEEQLNFDTTTTFHSSTKILMSDSIPLSIFQLTNLKHLSIQGMDCDYRVIDDKGNDITKCWAISEIPSQIKNLKQLETLELNVNALSKLPIELTELKNLKSLILDDNIGLSDIDNVIKIEGLEILSLNGCNISKLPDNIQQLKKLKSLGLAGNNISETEKKRIKKALPNCETYF
jgi:hypothetical protein